MISSCQRTQRFETQEHRQLKVLEEHSTDPAQIARAALRHDSCGTQFEKVACFGTAREHFVDGDRGASEWTLSGTTTEGQRIEVRGCDLWTLRDGQVVKKDSFWKIRTPV